MLNWMVWNRTDYNIFKNYQTKLRTCEIYIRESEIHEIGSGTKLSFTFLSLRFFDMKREKHNFFLCWISIWPSPRAAPAANYWSGLGELRKSTCFVQAQISTRCFFSNPKILSPSLPGMTSYTSPVIFPIWVFIVTSVIVTSSPRAREHLHSMCAPN